jgi:hypothetical protein
MRSCILALAGAIAGLACCLPHFAQAACQKSTDVPEARSCSAGVDAGRQPAAPSIRENGPELDGEAVTCDLPTSEHLRNAGSTIDGRGLCVFTSIDHAARWANEPALIGFRDFMRRYPGGGYPEKVDEFIPRMARSKGLPIPAYVQHTGGDPEFLRLALKTGRYPCVTYSGRDGVFYRGSVAHMVNLVHLSERWAVIQDNNFPGRWLWMPPAEFLARWQGSGGGWAIVLLKPGPPPIPINLVALHRPNPGPTHFSTEEGMQFAPCLMSALVALGSPCGPRGCPTPTAPDDYRWQADPKYPEYRYLYRGRTQVGTFHPGPIGYRNLLADGTWSELCAPPVPLPVGVIANFGLDADRIAGAPEYWLNGRAVSRQEALAAFGTLTDDSSRLRLTVVGDEGLRKQVLADLASHPALLALRDRLAVQDYAPDHWAAAGVGFAPGVTVQPPPGPDGKAPVLFRFASYAGPESLAAAIRKADPLYRPERDPDPGRLSSSPSFDLSKVPPAAWAVGGFVLALLFARRKENR